MRKPLPSERGRHGNAPRRSCRCSGPPTTWTAAGLDAVVRQLAEEKYLKLGKIAQPIRAALTGRATSPGVFDVLEVLGPDEAIGRIEDQIKVSARYKLYGRPGSGSAACEAVLALSGLPHEIIDLERWPLGGAPAEILAISPLGQVPALVLPNGSVHDGIGGDLPLSR